MQPLNKSPKTLYTLIMYTFPCNHAPLSRSSLAKHEWWHQYIFTTFIWPYPRREAIFSNGSFKSIKYCCWFVIIRCNNINWYPWISIYTTMYNDFPPYKFMVPVYVPQAVGKGHSILTTVNCLAKALLYTQWTHTMHWLTYTPSLNLNSWWM